MRYDKLVPEYLDTLWLSCHSDQTGTRWTKTISILKTATQIDKSGLLDIKENNTNTKTKPNTNTKANTETKNGLVDHPRQGHPPAADLGMRENSASTTKSWKSWPQTRPTSSAGNLELIRRNRLMAGRDVDSRQWRESENSKLWKRANLEST